MLEKPLPAETAEQKKFAMRKLKKMYQPYREISRDNIDGEINIGKSINLMEDFFAYAFLCQLKRKIIYNDGEESEPEPEEEKNVAGDKEQEKKKEDGPDAESEEEKQENMPSEYKSHASHRISIFSNFYLLVAAQLILLWYMLLEATSDPDMLNDLQMVPEGCETIIARFICAMIMHIGLAGEIKQGLQMMKYASNHPWKFRSWRKAFFIGFCQMVVLLTCEAVNLIILTA